MTRCRRTGFCCLLLGVGLLFAGPAVAHPHVWVTAHSELLYAPDGSVTGVEHHWTFDDGFSAFAVQGLQHDADGGFSESILAPLAQVNVESLKEFGYFTFATEDGKKAPFGDPKPGYTLDYDKGKGELTLNFMLPFKHPVKAKSLNIEIYDPTIFVDFELAKDHPVRLKGAPSRCKLDAQTAAGISVSQSVSLGEAFFNALSPTGNWGERFANRIAVTCP